MAVCWDSTNCHCFATSDPRKGRFAACGPKSMCVDAGLFPYLVLTSFWTSVFSFIRTHPAVYKLGKGPASRFCLWASTVPTKKGPLETGVPMGFDQKRIEHNRTMIVWSRLVKASVSNGERGFARSVPGQGSWRAFWLGIAVKRKHCKDLGVWVLAGLHQTFYGDIMRSITNTLIWVCLKDDLPAKPKLWHFCEENHEMLLIIGNDYHHWMLGF